jgi:hypothetical protein
MNDEPSSPAARANVLLPITLIAVSVALFFGWEIATLNSQRKTLGDAQAQVAAMIKNREPAVAQALALKTRFEALATDLVELAKTDPKAEALVKKYSIREGLAANQRK